MNLSKKELREIWVIYLLLNKDHALQQEIINELNQLAQDMLDVCIDNFEVDLSYEYDPEKNEQYFLSFEDEEKYYDNFFKDKNYEIDIEDLKEIYKKGHLGDVSGIEELLYKLEMISTEELDQIDLDDYSDEIYYLVSLRNLYRMKFKQISDPMISITLKNLRDQHILETNPSEKLGRGPSPNSNYLKRDFTALAKILNKLSNPKLDSLSNFFASVIMSSKYLEDMLDLTIVEKLEKSFRLEFNLQQKEMILNIIKISPSSLSKVLEYIEKKYWSGIHYSTIKHSFSDDEKIKLLLFELQVLLGNDLKRMPFVMSKIKYRIIIDFESNEDHLDGQIQQLYDGNKIVSTLTPDTKKHNRYWIHSEIENSPL